MFQAPNYTQTPNEFFDTLAKTLKEGELRCVLVFMRQIFGWQKKGDRISISQLMEKTGMEKKAVVASVKSLVEKKIIIKHKLGDAHNSPCWYTFAVAQSEPEKEYPPEDENGNPIEDSNKSSWYPKDTRGGILKIPTKETNTKERDTDPPNPPKGGKSPPLRERAPYVKTTDEQHEKLCKEFGEELTEASYEHLSIWKEEQPKRKRGGDDNRKIRTWVLEAVLKKRKSEKFVHDELKKTVKSKKPQGNVPKWLLESE